MTNDESRTRHDKLHHDLSPVVIHRPSFVIRHSSFPLSLLVLCLGLGCGPRENADRGAEGFWWPEEPVSGVQKRQEVEAKLVRVREFLRAEKIGGLLIGRAENFAWVSAGGDNRENSLLFLRDDGKNFLIGGEGPARRLLAEDLKGLDFEPKVVPWYRAGEESTSVRSVVAEVAGGREFGSDTPIGGARPVEAGIRALRAPLTPSEVTKYRWLGKTSARVMGEVARGIRPDMTERGIEAIASAALATRAIQAVDVRVAVDGRISRFPDAPPSDSAKLERFVRIGVRARRWGMDVALTRCIHFGALPDDVKRELEAAARVCAGYWARTLQGARAGTVLQDALADYAAAGFPDEWKTRDQGGAIGYGGWDWIALPGSQERVLSEQTFAWHPEIRGVGMEDTVLLLGENLEILTQIEDWPVVEAKSLGRIYRLPAILIRQKLK